MKKTKYIILFLSVVFSGSLAHISSAAKLTDIPLEWKATDKVTDKANDKGPINIDAYKNIKFTITPFSDLRSIPAEIGRNLNGSTKYPPLVTTKDNVANWLTEQVANLLREYGLNVAKNDGNVNLEADIIKFYVVEKHLYDGVVELRWRLKSTGGDIIWEGITSDESHRFGGSYKAENYFESLCNATTGAVDTLLKTDSFMQALKNVNSSNKAQVSQASQVDEQSKKVVQDMPKSPHPDEQSIEKKLAKLKNLYERKLITKDEYDTERKKALDRL